MTAMNYSVCGNNICFESGSSVDLPASIEEHICVDQVILATIDSGPEGRTSRNAFAVSEFGETLWSLDALELFGGGGIDYFTGFWVIDGRTGATTWSGWAIHVDPVTGLVGQRWFVK